jgi:uncharacterized radical SAM superfamily Fe-S cluster-containing enzyme
MFLNGSRHQQRNAVFAYWDESREQWVETPEWKADRDSIRVGLALTERQGIGLGDGVGLWIPLGVEWAVIERGVWLAGGMTIPLSLEWELGDIREVLSVFQPRVLFAVGGDAVQKLRILGGVPECVQRIVVLESGADSADVVSFIDFLADGGLLDTAERAATLRAGARSLAGEAIATAETRRESGKLLHETVDHRTMVGEIEALVEERPPRTESDRILSSLRPERHHRAMLYASWADGLTRTVFAATPAARDNIQALPVASRPDKTKPPMILEKNEASKLRRRLRGWISSLFAATAKHVSKLSWHAFQALNTRIPDSPSIHPDWAPRPLLKSYERTKPPLGWPRQTDSLCPDCVIEARDGVVSGERSLTEVLEKRSGVIPARIVEEDGHLLIRKHCEEHGEFSDLLSIDPKLSGILESRFYGRDFLTAFDEHVHHHGSSTIHYGRGSVLTVDLTNRCNMMCNPCFVDANQVGYVHELTIDEIRRILDDSISFKPRRQLSVQFSGGEPTLSPHFLDACSYAKEVGYWSVQAASNGLRFALEPEFAFQAKEAGLNMLYLQLDGVTNEANRHRHITNLFEAKEKAIEHLFDAGIDITPVTTIVNTVNNDQVGPILEYMIRNSDKIGAISYQPVSFTGRDESISDADRRRMRYTVTHLAHDLARHFEGRIDLYRDWYPLGSIGAFTSLSDHLRGPDVHFGGMNCSCHPNCGASLVLVVNWVTKAWTPLTAFFDVEQFVGDIQIIGDTSRGQRLSQVQAVMAFLRNLDQSKMPAGLTVSKFLRLINRKMGGMFDRQVIEDEWNIMWVGGMWFQDLWTYDFRRTEMCVIPYGTQEGEISFCAYNTGLGWRQIVEGMHQVASTREWFQSRGRHQIYAGNRPMNMNPGSCRSCGSPDEELVDFKV